MPQTALCKAVRHGDMINVRRLLLVGADPNETFAGRSLLSYAAAQGNTPMLRLLLDAGATPDWHALQMAAFGNHAKAVQLLLAAGAPTDAEKGETPLLNVLKSGASAEDPGRVRVIQLLREAGAREGPEWRGLGWGRSIRYVGWRWWFGRLLYSIGYSIGWLPKRWRRSN